MAKASIIIPVYNVERYVRKTIDSACFQTEEDIEIILVDDGSTDSCGIICDEIAKTDSRIKVIHKQNGGLSSARNAGTMAATAAYIMFLDGDDYLRKDAVACCLKTMEDYPCDFIQFLYQEIEEGQEPLLREFSEEVYQATTSKELFENLYHLGGVAASGATKFMKRELALAVPFENIRHEDEMWCTRAFAQNLTAVYLPEELYYYVMRNGSIIHSVFSKKRLDLFTVSEERCRVLAQLGYGHLLEQEYAKLYINLLSTYREAKSSRNDEALDFLRGLFARNKKQIGDSGFLPAKFRFFYRLMCVNYHFIYLYTLYWAIKK